MAAHDPDVRHLAAVKAGLTSAANKTQAEHQAAMQRAREAQRQALIREADPDGTLAATDPAELDRRVKLLRRTRLVDMALKSAAVRAERRAAEQAAQENAELDALAAEAVA